MSAAEVMLWASLGLGLYAYIGYPSLLALLALGRRRQAARAALLRWPEISITVPVHNEAATIAATLESLLALDYPARRQILVVSDASTDGTDDIVSRFAARGVELLRLLERRGKTAAENAARPYLTGEIIVNTDASVRIHPRAVKHLVAAFADPSVAVASGCDVSVARLDDRTNPGEQAYVGYEMWVRDLETKLHGIVGASGCLYAIRADLHRQVVPEALSRDFAAALVAREHGYRAVSVPEALCYVPRSPSLREEYWRKVRTITRGLGTLVHKRALLNPCRDGLFAWMLFSHKLCRWLVPWALLAVLGALGVLVLAHPAARWAVAVAAGGALLAAVGCLWPADRPRPRVAALPAYVAAGAVATLHAWILLWLGRTQPTWEPTRRDGADRLVGATRRRAARA